MNDSNIATLSTVLAQHQGRDVMLYRYEEFFCRNMEDCRFSYTGRRGQKCYGHLKDSGSSQRVRLNFCELLSDRLVIRCSMWRFDDGMPPVLEKQRRLHLMEAAISRGGCYDDPTWIMIPLQSGRVKQLDIVLCDRWRYGYS